MPFLLNNSQKTITKSHGPPWLLFVNGNGVVAKIFMPNGRPSEVKSVMWSRAAPVMF
jgi:hypothetical protein